MWFVFLLFQFRLAYTLECCVYISVLQMFEIVYTSLGRVSTQHDLPANSASFFARQDDETQSKHVQPENHQRSGSAGIIESMMLLHSFQNMHAPVIQVLILKFSVMPFIVLFMSVFKHLNTIFCHV